MSLVDGKEQDGFMVADEPELRSGKGGGEREFGNGLSLGFLAKVVELGQGTGVFGLFIVCRSELEFVAALADALCGILPESANLSVEISNRVVCGSSSVEAHDG